NPFSSPNVSARSFKRMRRNPIKRRSTRMAGDLHDRDWHAGTEKGRGTTTRDVQTILGLKMTHEALKSSGRGEQAVIQAGSGTPLVLLHCGAGSSRSYLPIIEDLSSDFRVTAPDLLGYGANPPWERGARYDLDMELDLVWPYLADAHEPVHLV